MAVRFISSSSSLLIYRISKYDLKPHLLLFMAIKNSRKYAQKLHIA